MVRKWLIARREELDMTQGQVAEQVGISQPSYCDIESGKTKYPRPDTARKIGAVLGFPGTKFFEASSESEEDADA